VTNEPAASVNVAQLMEEIKARVRQRRASGYYSEEEVRRVAQMELEVGEVVPGLREELEHHLAALNDSWDALREPVVTSHRPGVGRVIVGFKRLMLRLMRPYTTLALQRQLDFNTTLLHLLNAFVLPVRDKFPELASQLVARVNQVESKLAAELTERLNHRLDYHMEARFEALTRTMHDWLAAGRGEAQERHHALAASLDEQLRDVIAELASLRAGLDRVRFPGAGAPLALVPPPPVSPGTGELSSAAYLAFEDRHRGSLDEIRRRQREYLDLFTQVPILDIGCGRGEFLQLCREAQREARGIDINPAMVASCRDANLDVVQAEALAYLQGLPDDSLGGIFCAQVIEHLTSEAFVALARLAHAKLRPGGVLVCETPNPASLTVFAGPFYVDLTHIKPIHAEASRFVLDAAGFQDVELRFVNPYPFEQTLQPIKTFWYMRPYEEEFLQALNENFARVNRILWGPQDYAVVGHKPRA
jgi:SAM-dependent methyltransferase